MSPPSHRILIPPQLVRTERNLRKADSSRTLGCIESGSRSLRQSDKGRRNGSSVDARPACGLAMPRSLARRICAMCSSEFSDLDLVPQRHLKQLRDRLRTLRQTGDYLVDLSIEVLDLGLERLDQLLVAIVANHKELQVFR